MSIPIHAPAPLLDMPHPPSRPSSPFPPRPPSRSERMLRDALLRDELERHPPLPPAPSPRRRTSPPRVHGCDTCGGHNLYCSCYYENHDKDRDYWSSRTSALFRTSAAGTGVNNNTSPNTSPRLVRNRSTSHVVQHAQQQQRQRQDKHRNSSPPPSPTVPTRLHHPIRRSSNSVSEGMVMGVAIPPPAQRRRHSRSNSSAAGSPPVYGSPPSDALTPHEQVLKARLERVLGDAAIAEDRRRSVEKEREKKTRKSLDRKRSTGRKSTSNEDVEHSSWKWGQIHDSPISSEGSSETSNRPSPQTPPQTLSPHTPPHSSTSLPLFLTPPPTPPSHPHSRSHSSHSQDSHDDQDPYRELSKSPPSHIIQTHSFNARKASARCRQMEGYVSFAAVEGLGEPPSGIDDELECEEGKQGGLANGFKNLKLWRVWPFGETPGEQQHATH